MHSDDLLPGRVIFGADGGNMLRSAKIKHKVLGVDTCGVAI
jgi:hypothetical protein